MKKLVRFLVMSFGLLIGMLICAVGMGISVLAMHKAFISKDVVVGLMVAPYFPLGIFATMHVYKEFMNRVEEMADGKSEYFLRHLQAFESEQVDVLVEKYGASGS